MYVSRPPTILPGAVEVQTNWRAQARKIYANDPLNSTYGVWDEDRFMKKKTVRICRYFWYKIVREFFVVHPVYFPWQRPPTFDLNCHPRFRNNQLTEEEFTFISRAECWRYDLCQNAGIFAAGSRNFYYPFHLTPSSYIIAMARSTISSSTCVHHGTWYSTWYP